ncbi:helix-turn-helix transcriptional regulator [Saccharothrix violaceirubra]
MDIVAAKKSMPTVRLRRLATQLRRLREGADLTREEVAERTNINAATLYRIETAKSRPQTRTLLTLLDLYDTPADEQERLKTLSKESVKPGWIRPWHESLAEEYTTYISFEDEAQGMRNYSGLFMPGLLQTEDYARAVIGGVLHSATTEQIEDRVRTRMERRAVLTKERPLHLWAVIDEAALRREIGGREVMHAQLEHLRQTAMVATVKIQIIPFSSGSHPGMPGQFVVMEFEDPMDADLIYVDGQAGETLLESETDIKRFRSDFDHLVAVAMSPNDSSAFIAEIASEYRRNEARP